MNSKKAAFIVEHDFIMATYLADKYYIIDILIQKKTNIIRVIVYEGEPGINCVANSP
jgi:ATP-binding cassette subfamily E protein 1